MARTLIVSDRHNSFFSSNNIRVGNSIPVEGNYVKGDIIVNIGENTATEAMWICVESGNPGVWEVVGAGSSNGSSSSLVSINDTVFVNEPVNEVSLGGLGSVITASDKLIVHHNSIHLMEGVDYEIDVVNNKIVKLTDGYWNEESEEAMFAFELFKSVESIEGDKIVVASKLTSISNQVIIESASSEIEIGIDGFVAGNDMLMVFKNGLLMVEGVDYTIGENSDKIISTGEVWNENGLEDYGIVMVVFKEVVEYNSEMNAGIIEMEHLSDDVKEVIEEASNIDLSGYATKDELPVNVSELNNDVGYINEHQDISGKQDVTDEELITNDKTIVGAINELFINANNGKQLIADAIGNEYITVDSTFSAMSEAIIGLHKETSSDSEDSREVLYNMMIEDGYDEATSDMTVDELIELLDESNIEISEIKQIACGDYHTFILKNDGSVYSCGLNEDGQLGLGDTTNRTTFTQVTTNINNDVEQIACGYYHTFILKNDGSVYSCGFNNNGQLGLGDIITRTSFTQVTTNVNNDVEQIVCGGNHTFILKDDGSVYSCGLNGSGQLGLGSKDNKTSFTKVTTNINNDVKQIACGEYHTFILKNDGSVYSCGYNYYGGLGLGNYTNKTSFTKVTTNINNDVEQIACGRYYTFILKNDGSVYSCGLNEYGELGLGDTDSTTFTQVTTNINNDVKQIVCGTNHTFILKNDGSVYSCGNNDKGQTGLGSKIDEVLTFTQVTTNINNDVAQIACGCEYTFILKNDGSVYSCGYNYYGQLGLGDTTTRYTFTQVPLSTSITEYEISRLKLYYYLLDNDIEVTEDMDIGTMLDCLVNYNINNKLNGYITNLKIVLSDEGVEVTDEDDMNSLITKTDEEFAKGNEEISNLNSEIDELESDAESTRSTLADLMLGGGYDIIGDEDIDNLLDLLELSGISVSDIKQVSSGFTHTFVLKNNGKVYSCGENDYGQLGLGDTTNRTSFKQVTTNINSDVKQIACGMYHTFILKNDGSVYSCGYNGSGQLGLGTTDTNAHSTFTQVTSNINNDVKQIACGNTHNFILKNDGSVYSCGYNYNGELGLGDTTDRTTFTQVTTNINNDVKQIISSGCSAHTFILKNDGSIYGCGYNNYGQLGLGNTTKKTIFTQVTTNIDNDVKRIACGDDYTFILKNDGSVYSCGYNGYGQLGLGNTTKKTTFTQVTTNINNDVKQIACGLYHTFILKNDGSVYSCGRNLYGQLGLGDTNDRTTFTQVTSTSNMFTQIVCCNNHTFVVKNGIYIYSCGRNDCGQLGLGSSTTTNTSFTQVTSITNTEAF